MKKLFLFLLIFINFFLLIKKDIYAQENNPCPYYVLESQFGLNSPNGAEICQIIDKERKIKADLSNNELLIYISMPPVEDNNSNIDADIYKTYFKCNNGKWKRIKLNDGLCSMETAEASLGFDPTRALDYANDLRITKIIPSATVTASPQQNNENTTAPDEKATPPGKLGGKCRIDDISKNIEKIDVPKIKGPEDTGDKWGCIGFNFIINVNLWCFSDLFNSAKQAAANFLIRDIAMQELIKLNVCEPGLEPSTLDVNNPNCICINPKEKGLSKISDILCNRYIDQKKEVKEKLNSKEFLGCSDCFASGGYWSAIGCIYFSDWKTFFEKNVFGLSIGIAGLIALFCIIYAAFQIQTSSGNAEKVKKAQELLTSCIMGLMLIIFSIFILKLIGVDILRIPGFGK